MILKHFNFNKLNKNQFKIFLLYGENSGLKNEFIDKYFKIKNGPTIFNYDENEIFDDERKIFDHFLTKSFFDKEKLIIISRATDKSKSMIDEILEKNNDEITIILLAEILEKKSKLRKLAETDEKIASIAFYPDEERSLTMLANEYFRENKIPISREIVNLIVNRSRNDRQNLKNEMEKIKYSLIGKKTINLDDIKKITNTAENYSISELVDNCLAQKINKFNLIMNENRFNHQDVIIIVKTFLYKARRLLKLNQMIDTKNTSDNAITLIKPPIFWKDKEIVKNQLKFWDTKKTIKLIYEINEIELLIKKNFQNSLIILLNFIFSNAKKN